MNYAHDFNAQKNDGGAPLEDDFFGDVAMRHRVACTFGDLMHKDAIVASQGAKKRFGYHKGVGVVSHLQHLFQTGNVIKRVGPVMKALCTDFMGYVLPTFEFCSQHRWESVQRCAKQHISWESRY